MQSAPAQDEPIDPILLGRLLRNLQQPGLLQPVPLRRILAWLDYFAGRLGLLGLLAQRRGVRSFTAPDLAIVHARPITHDHTTTIHHDVAHVNGATVHTHSVVHEHTSTVHTATAPLDLPPIHPAAHEPTTVTHDAGAVPRITSASAHSVVFPRIASASAHSAAHVVATLTHDNTPDRTPAERTTPADDETIPDRAADAHSSAPTHTNTVHDATAPHAHSVVHVHPVTHAHTAIVHDAPAREHRAALGDTHERPVASSPPVTSSPPPTPGLTVPSSTPSTDISPHSTTIYLSTSSDATHIIHAIGVPTLAVSPEHTLPVIKPRLPDPTTSPASPPHSPISTANRHVVPQTEARSDSSTHVLRDISRVSPVDPPGAPRPTTPAILQPRDPPASTSAPLVRPHAARSTIPTTTPSAPLHQPARVVTTPTVAYIDPLTRTSTTLPATTPSFAHAASKTVMPTSATYGAAPTSASSSVSTRLPLVRPPTARQASTTETTAPAALLTASSSTPASIAAVANPANPAAIPPIAQGRIEEMLDLEALVDRVQRRLAQRGAAERQRRGGF